MNVVFLMDPLEKVHPTKDTTLMLMVGAKRRGHTVFFLPDGGLSLHEGQLSFDTVEVTPTLKQTPPFEIGQRRQLTQENVGAVFIRLDPPFNERYLMNTWLLDRLPASVPVINAPAGIRTVNEKIWATQFTSLMPRTLITRNLETARAFIDEQAEAIIKPTDGFGGQGVIRIRSRDSRLVQVLEKATHRGTKEIIVQPFIPEAAQGDKRILLLDGAALGAVMRVHNETDFRNNLMAGGRAEPTTITDEDQKIIDALAPHLKTLGLTFVGLDIIGRYLTEVNVTSPTCLQEMNRLYDKQLEDSVIALMERLANHPAPSAQRST